MSVFRKTLPVLTTSFINKCGTIGMSLLPILLVDLHFSLAQSTFAMTVVKASLLVGVLAGGWCCDRVGLKRSLLFSFFLSGTAFALLPFSKIFSSLCCLAVMAQIGQAMARTPLRLLLTAVVPDESQQESIGWLRTANNLGQILSYSIGSLFSSGGIAVLMLFDSITSFAAAGAGVKILPEASSRGSVSVYSLEGEGRRDSWRLFFLCALILAGFVFLYDLFMISAAAHCQLRFGDSGLSVFSRLMMINAILCTVFAVLASRAFRNPTWVFPIGVVLVAAGSALFFIKDASVAMLFLGFLLLTLGEVLFTSVGTYVLLRVTPTVSVRGSLYSFALTIEALGQILAGAPAFPIMVHGSHPVAFVGGSAALVLSLCFAARNGLKRIYQFNQPHFLDSLSLRKGNAEGRASEVTSRRHPRT